ncbi:MAG TPA: PBP1A family penicillin-binding protein [Gemmatimonadaceae bacterium]|nr:PBP1A family penicillin-binding protein [Gemmatimonadaceae bacterium]
MPTLPSPLRFWRAHPRLIRWLVLVFIFGVAFIGGAAYGAWTLACRGNACPSVAVLDQFTPRQTSKLYAADGRFITEIGLERRTLVKLDEIPPLVKQAFIITEDKRFYRHHGIDWIRVFGAGLRNLRAGGYAQGFSTLTMQLARNIFTQKITREKTLTRKIKEAKVAVEIEKHYPKSKILELYLNQIYLGNGAYGVETASQRYFGKSVRDLNLAEAATLAALPKGPGRYNPRLHPARAIQRRNTIIGLMQQAGVVTQSQAQLAKAYPLRLARKENSGELAPYFVQWVRKQLDERFGQSLYTEGLKVYTTLDVDLQTAAERALENQLEAIEAGKYGKYPHLTYAQYLARNGDGDPDASSSPYLQGAFIVIDPRNGAVRAMVGGRDFDDSKFNRATQALRQPGSTFKPVVYSAAIHSGRPPSYLVDDTVVTWEEPDGTIWAPDNFDHKYWGMIPMRRALYMSRNLATINLGMELGEPTVIDMARRLGISSPILPVPSINIGAASVYPLEMIDAYTTFASLGVRSAPFGIVRVENARGDVLWESTPQRYQVLSREEAWLMVNMLEDVVQRGTAYSAVWRAGFHVPAGGKTGTTNDGTNVWFIGFTPELVAGVWMGFDQPQKIKTNAQGGLLAAPAWTAFMKEIYENRPTPKDWPMPPTILTRQIDKTTGLLRNAFCPDSVVVTAYFIPGTEPIRDCDVHTAFNTLPFPDSTNRGAFPPVRPGTAGARPTPPGARRDSTPPRSLPDPFRLPPHR